MRASLPSPSSSSPPPPPPPPPLPLSVDGERLLASLAIAHTQGGETGGEHDHTHNGAKADSDTRAHAHHSLCESRSSSSLYAQHVLHQIALAATPRHRIGATQTQRQQAGGQAAPLSTAVPPSPTGLDFEFALSDADLQFDVTLEGDDEGGDDEQQHTHTTTDAGEDRPPSGSLPLAHLNPAQPATSAAEMSAEHLLQSIAAEVESAEESAAQESAAVPAAALSSQWPSVISVTQAAGSSAQSAGPATSPQYLLSPGTQAEFDEVQQWSTHFDVQLTPTATETATARQEEQRCDDPSVLESDRALLHRARIIDELLSSERSYLRALDALVQFYLQPLRADLLAGLPTSVHVSAAQQTTLFGQVEIIAQLSRRLYADLEAAVGAHSPTHIGDSASVSSVVPGVGSIMLRFSPFFKMYTGYVANHEKSSALLRSLEKNKDFAAWCTRQRTLSGSSLQSLLIAPVQRVPRYSLLLQELLRRTPASHPDFSSLTRALSLVNHAASHINESVRAAENRAHILALQERFNHSVVLLTPTRWFVRQSPLTKQGRHSDVEYEFLLFSDLLLYASRSALGGSLKLHHSIPLDHSFQFASLPDQTEEDGTDTPQQQAATSTRDNTTPTSSNATLAIGPEQRNPSVSPAPMLSPLPPSRPDRATTASAVSPVSLTLAVPSVAPASAVAATVVSFPSRFHHRFLIESSHRSFVVYARSASLKRAWLSDLQAVTMQIRLQENQRKENVAMAKAAGGHHSTRSTDITTDTHAVDPVGLAALSASCVPAPAVSSPLPSFGRLQPVMERYKSSSACFVCSKQCTSFSGRRHCQACGRVCCSRCCRTELLLEWSRKESKCCDTCVDKLKRSKERSMHEAAAATAPLVSCASPSVAPLVPFAVSSVAPPVPVSSRPLASSLRPRRPSRPSEGAISTLIESAHSRQASAEMQHSAANKHAPTTAQLHADTDTATANSDEEPDDSAGILSPKAICA